MWALLVLALIGSVLTSPEDFDVITQGVELPLLAKKVKMGQTVNQNDLNVYILTKIRYEKVEELWGLNAIVVNSYMHAREPYSADLMKTLYKSVIESSKSDGLDYFLRNGVFIFFPYVNIDGYNMYMQAQPNKKEQIRKNLNHNGIRCTPPLISGVDINRNFPSSFGIIPESSSPCSEEYHGLAPFSEKESTVFEILFKQYKVMIAIDIHSYGNEWIYPYASDGTGNRVLKNKLFPFYDQVITGLNRRGKGIKSCKQSLQYVADGVYIDWALDQGALSFAYEVGRNFNQDNLIDEAIKTSLDDFFYIFSLADPSYEYYFSNDSQLVLKSKSLSTLDLRVTINSIQSRTLLKPGEQIVIAYRSGVDKIVDILVLNSRFLQTIRLQKSTDHYLAILCGFVIFLFLLSRQIYLIKASKSSKPKGRGFRTINLQEKSSIDFEEVASPQAVAAL